MAATQQFILIFDCTLQLYKDTQADDRKCCTLEKSYTIESCILYSTDLLMKLQETFSIWIHRVNKRANNKIKEKKRRKKN